MLHRAFFTTAIALAAVPALATTYTLDPAHTQVLFSWNHFGYSHPAAEFGTLSGTLNFDPAHPTQASVKVTIPLASVHSNVEKLDQDLVSPKFFDAAKFPAATFTSTSVEAGSSADKLKVIGSLTLHGVTKPVTLDVTINRVGEHPMRKAKAAGFDAKATIKRSEFGMNAYVPMVSDDIDIHITAEAIEATAYAQSLKSQAKQ